MSKYAKPSTLSLPSPDQQISARWLIQKIRSEMIGGDSRFAEGRMHGLNKLAQSVIRKAHNLHAKRCRR